MARQVGTRTALFGGTPITRPNHLIKKSLGRSAGSRVAIRPGQTAQVGVVSGPTLPRKFPHDYTKRMPQELGKQQGTWKPEWDDLWSKFTGITKYQAPI